MRPPAFSLPKPQSVFALVAAAVLASCAKQAPPPSPPPAPIAFIEEVMPEAPYCAKPAEKTAFDIAALKTRLVVAAISCGDADRYNGFIIKNRPGLVTQEKNLSSYFSRNYGRSGQTKQDDYITQLANLQAQRRTRDTAAFCKDTGGTFDEVAAVKTPVELNNLASAKQVAQPMRLAECQ